MKTLIIFFTIVWLLALIVGCGENSQEHADASSAVAESAATAEAEPATTAKPPFEFTEIERNEKPHDLGPQIAIVLETTNDVAKKATKEDLQALWDFFSPTFGDRRAFIHVQADVPGVTPWGIISRYRDPLTGKWEFNIERNEFGIDAEPYYFVSKIDRSVQNQSAMVLTLPVVNRIVEQVKRHGWEVKRRTEDFVSAEVNNVGQSASLTMTPEHLSFDGYRLDDLIFVDTAASILDELGIGDQVKAKLQTVIGSPEYLRAESGE